MIIFRFLLLLLVLLPVYVFAQDTLPEPVIPAPTEETADTIIAPTDTTETADTIAFTPPVILPSWYYKSKPFEHFVIDTSLDEIHRQFHHPFDENLGNLGLPAYSLLMPQPDVNLFGLGMDAYDIYMIPEDEIIHFTSPRPYSELFFMTGIPEKLAVGAEYAQNITEQLKVGMNFRRLSSKGFYQRQRTLHNNLDVNLRFRSRNYRYDAMADFLLNRISALENGGISDPALFNGENLLSKELVQVNLISSDTRSGNNTWHLSHGWNFGALYSIPINDTTVFEGLHTTFRLSHTFFYKSSDYIFTDITPTAGLHYYNRFGLNDLPDDTMQLRQEWYQLSNKIKLQYTGRTADGKARNLQGEVFFQQQATNLYQPWRHFSDNGFAAGAEVENFDESESPLLYRLYYNRNLTGADAGNFQSSVAAGFSFGKAGDLMASYRDALNGTPEITNSFQFRDFGWETDFVPERYRTVGVSYANELINVEAEAARHQIGSYLYYDSLSIPVQLDERMSQWVFSLRHKLRVGKIFLENSLVYQTIPDENLYRVPQFIYYGSLYAEGYLFARSMLGKAGISMHYRSPFKAVGYFPLTGQFYNAGNQTLSMYPVFDVFLSTRIKTARIFLIVEHVNQGLFGNGYFTAAGYPAADRNFRAGIYWRFLD